MTFLYLSLLLIAYLPTMNRCEENCETFPGRNEESSLILDLITTLRINNCIFTGKNYSQLLNTSHFKSVSSFKVYIRFKLTRKLCQYIIAARSFENPKTMIIFHEEDLAAIKDCFSFLNKERGLFVASKFTWLMTTNELNIFSANEILFKLIPYDCRFIVASKGQTDFELFSVYSLGHEKVITKYATWHEKLGFNVLQISMYPGKINMNQTKFTGLAVICPEDGESFVQSYCISPYLFKHLLRSMNFRYEEVVGKLSVADTNPNIDAVVDELIYSHLYPTSSFIKYLPTADYCIFIKHPETKNAEDFYIRPFSSNLWAAVGITIFVGGLISIIIKYAEIIGRKQLKYLNVVDYVFTTYESLCNQGRENNENTPFRICFIFFRFLALFIFPAYCADLKAYLSIETIKLPFRNLEEFIENGEYKLLITHNGFTNTYFTKRNTSASRRITELSLTEYYESFWDLKRLCSNEKLALPYYLENLPVPIGCKLYRIPQPISKIFKFLILSIDNPFVKIINHVFLQAREAGLNSRISRTMIWPTRETFQTSEDFQTVGINQLTHILLFLAAGTFLGFIFLIFELLIKNRKAITRSFCLVEYGRYRDIMNKAN